MAKVTGHSKPARGRLHKITIERAGNGFSIRRHHESPPGAMIGTMNPDEPPQVFQAKQAPAAHKHVKALMAAMHPEQMSDDAISGTQMQGYEPESQQQ